MASDLKGVVYDRDRCRKSQYSYLALKKDSGSHLFLI
jgi:hypothetical protein